MTKKDSAEHVESVSVTNGENIVEQPKKKRGRPSKAELAARAAAEAAAALAASAETNAVENGDATVATEVEVTSGSTPEAEAVPVSASVAENEVKYESEQDSPVAEPVKRRRVRRTKAEILAAAAEAAAVMSKKHQQAAQQDLFQEDPMQQIEDPSAGYNDMQNMGEDLSVESVVPEATFANDENMTEDDNERLGLLEKLQSKVEAHNAEFAVEDEQVEIVEDTVWEEDPADGTDFIIVTDLPVEDNAAIPYYDMFDNPVSGVNGDGGEENESQEYNEQGKYDFSDLLMASGLLEIMPDGYGFLRSSDYNYLSSPDDVHLSMQQIKQYALKTGDVVQCKVRPPRDNEKYFVMTSIVSVNGRDPHDIRDRISFENLTPLFPDEKFRLCGSPQTTNKSTRIVDLFSPIGKGQRSLIVAQPKTGKTVLMKDIANAIAANHPEAYIMMLLIDERPEEVTDMARTVNAEVIASTFDEPADRHVKIAGLVLEKAKRLVECGHDVVIFLDSITRLARAYNTVAPASGKVLTGGVDANALQKPKRFFGAARNIEGGGSLTIIATALTDTGSKMDEVIFEEFKGTGNSELQLDRQLANRRIYPAVNLVQSSTRRDDLLWDDVTIQRMWILRKHIADMTSVEAMNVVGSLMDRCRSNDDLLTAAQSD